MAKQQAGEERKNLHLQQKQEEKRAPEKDVQSQTAASTVQRLQQTVGNRVVRRFLAQRRSAEQTGPAPVDDELSEAIDRERGGGAAVDGGIAAKAGRAMGQDLAEVRVHTGPTADALSRSLAATAFTTGSDIFFREGAYEPGSSAGQRLIAHELTHVVQQGGGAPELQGKMTVNAPGDEYEVEADRVADTVMNQEEPVQLQEHPEDEDELQLQASDEEEEEEMIEP